MLEVGPAYQEAPFQVQVVEPRKTFLEKLFLLHEEFGKPDKMKIRTERMSRHLYDIESIMNTSFGEAAINDHGLYNYLIQHRKWYSRISWVDYESHKHNTLSFIPPSEVIELFRLDYQAMQEQMIYGEAIPFEELISQLEVLKDRLRSVKNPENFL